MTAPATRCAVVTANWSAADNISAVDTASGTAPSGGPLDTAAVGDHAFKVTATDLAGNTAEKSVVYHVHYVYGGILPPVSLDGRSLFKLGSTIPVKFQLTDANGNFVTTAIAKLFVAQFSNNTLGDELVALSTSAASSGNQFRCDLTGNQYIFNLSTKPLSAGGWQMLISLDDGTSYTALFSLR